MARTHNLLIKASVCLALAGILLPVSPAEALPIRLGLSPDNNQSMLISTLKSARSELVINMYQFDSTAVTTALVEQIKAGVTVRLLLEGQPVGNISASGQKVIDVIVDAMAKSKNKANKFFVMTSGSSASDSPADRADAAKKRRFRFDHAKYVVIDGTDTLITSENFTSTGHADPGHKGNRGWETVIRDESFASQMTDMFAADTDTSYGDIQVMKLKRISGASIPADAHPGDKRAVPAQPQARGTADSVQLITSPNTSLDGLVDVIRSARDHLEIEQMSLPSVWRNPDPDQSPLVTEILEAARRGVSVRVLLNDENAFGGAPATGPDNGFELESINAFDWPWETDDTAAPKKRPNELTVDLLNHSAGCEGLELEGRIVDVKNVGITYIHNKGFLVDGKRAVVSSINGTANSVLNNRETAVILESEDAASYFGTAFDFDWTNSAKRRADRRKCTSIKAKTGPVKKKALVIESAWNLSALFAE